MPGKLRHQARAYPGFFIFKRNHSLINESLKGVRQKMLLFWIPESGKSGSYGWSRDVPVSGMCPGAFLSHECAHRNQELHLWCLFWLWRGHFGQVTCSSHGSARGSARGSPPEPSGSGMGTPGCPGMSPISTRSCSNTLQFGI